MKTHATFVSVWDGGIEIRSNCEFNPISKEVTDIDIAEVDGLETLEDEYVELPDGTEIRDFLIEGENENEDQLTSEEVDMLQSIIKSQSL
jgi:hypothetical protein